MRSRAMVLAVLLVFCGAPGARQPEVRCARAVAGAGARDRRRARDQRAGSQPTPPPRHSHALRNGRCQGGDTGSADADAPGCSRRPPPVLRETVPLPLDPSIWRETILQRPVPDEPIVATIIQDRRASLLYHGLAALDDETLAWLGPERDTLQPPASPPGRIRDLRTQHSRARGKNRGARRDRARNSLASVIGAEPDAAGAVRQAGCSATRTDSSPGSTTRCRSSTNASLDLNEWGAVPRPRADERDAGAARRLSRCRCRAEARNTAVHARWPFDPALTLAIMRVNAGWHGRRSGRQRGFWERCSRIDGGTRAPAPGREPANRDATPIDAAWLLSRLHRVPIDVGRRRLDMLLFAQRAFAKVDGADRC